MPTPVGTPAQASFNAAQVTPNLPTGYAAGDGILVVVSQDGTGTMSVNAGSTAGWTKIDQWTSGSATTTQAAFFKKNAVGVGSDGLIVDSTVSERGTYVSSAVTGQSTTTEPYVATGAAGPSGSDVCDPPNIVIGVVATYLFVALGGCGTNVNATAAPTNYSGLLSQSTTTSSMGTFMAFRELSASSEDPGVFTHAAGAWQAQTLAIPPSAGAPQNVSITAAVEADAAQALVVTKPIVKSITAAAEGDAAQALTVSGPILVSITAATESDAAVTLGITHPIQKTIAAAVEADAAVALSGGVVGPPQVFAWSGF